jgi:hypothetical protein
MNQRAGTWFGVALVLFLAWLAYLFWLVQGRPIQAPGYALVLSRPQILASPIDVIAEVPTKDGLKVKVIEVLHPAEDAPLKPGDVIDVASIDECHPVAPRGASPPDDWTEPGAYLVPLRPVPGAKGKYEVAPIPPSPGFGARVFNQPVRIYRDSAEVRAQYRKISKP